MFWVEVAHLLLAIQVYATSSVRKERELSERNNTRHKLLELSWTKVSALPRLAPSQCDKRMSINQERN